jgi:hypothetical protein
MSLFQLLSRWWATTYLLIRTLIYLLKFARGLFVSGGRLGVSGSIISGSGIGGSVVVTMVVFPIVLTVTIVAISPLDLCNISI